MATHTLDLPVDEATIRSLNVGDIIYLNGIVYTGRDEVHIHALEELDKGEELPIDLNGGAIYHCGPIMVKNDEGVWSMLAAGPTTSARMNKLEPAFIERTGVRFIIGKGGMDQGVVGAMKKFGAVYLAHTGGAAVIAAKGLRSVTGVHWPELGVPEAIWVIDAEKFGPLTVGIDAHGESLFARVDDRVAENYDAVREELGL